MPADLALIAIEFVAVCFLLWLAGRGLPGGNSLFFASPKKSKQKKGDPAGWVPSGNLRCPGKAGVELELAFGSDNRSP